MEFATSSLSMPCGRPGLEPPASQESLRRAHEPTPGVMICVAPRTSSQLGCQPASRRSARLAYNYRWSWLPGGDALFGGIDPHRWEVRHNAVRLLQEAFPPSPSASLGGRRPLPAGLLGGGMRVRGGAPAVAVPWNIRGAARRVLLRRVRRPPLAADLRRRPRRARRRPAEGGLRRGRCRSSRSGCSTARATSASASTSPAGSTSTGCRPIRICCPRRWSPRTAAARCWCRCRCAASRCWRRSGASTSGACRSTCSTPTGPRTPDRPLDHFAALRGRSRRAARPVRAARPRRRPGARGARHRPERAAPERGPRRPRHARTRCPEMRAGRSSDALAAVRARTVFTTHTPVPAGNETYERDAIVRAASGFRRAAVRPTGTASSRWPATIPRATTAASA